MSPNKRRKLDAAPSETPPLSAFAARRALLAQRSAPVLRNEESNSIPSESSKLLEENHSKNPIAQSSANGSRREPQAGPITPEQLNVQTTGTSTDDKSLITTADGDFPLSESRAESPEAPPERQSITLSTFKPSGDTLLRLGNGKILLNISPGDRVVILGVYDLCVQQGRITILGATLTKATTIYRIHAASSHSLPVMRCPATEVNGAMLSIRQVQDGLEALEPLSPLFGKLWNDRGDQHGPDRSSIASKAIKKSSFQILFSSDDGPKKVYLQPVISPAEWNQTLASLAKRTDQRKTPIVMICGPKNSGKSTFAKLFTNSLISATANPTDGSILNSKTGVALLDLDPGQPEYCTPGQLSLVLLREPNFSPPYSHPIPAKTSKIIRAHTIGAVSPSLDPNLYMTCALDLFAHYQNLTQTVPNCPLIINTPGWVFGTGLEILEELIARLKPTEVVYMSNEGPVEVTKSLRDAALKIPFLELPSQTSEYTTRTSAHLRTMQYMSYFHLEPKTDRGLVWNSLPLTSIPPWEIRYAGENPGVLGIMCYGEQPPADLLTDAINGSLVAVVVIDDKKAISGWESEDKGESEVPQDYNMEPEDAELRAFDDNPQQPQALEKPLIIRTPNEDLPYFNPGNVQSLNPTHSHTIGLALIRGIDINRRRLQVLTPISPTIIEEINESGKSIVLVSGKFDTPGWAYTEELNQKGNLDKAARRKQSVAAGNRDDDTNDEREDDEREVGDGFEKAPWIERLEGSQGRGVGARVLRVRRDLGRSGDGGD